MLDPRFLLVTGASLTLSLAPMFVSAPIHGVPPGELPTINQIIAGMPAISSPQTLAQFVVYNFRIGLQVANVIEAQALQMTVETMWPQAALTPHPPPPAVASANVALIPPTSSRADASQPIALGLAAGETNSP